MPGDGDRFEDLRLEVPGRAFARDARAIGEDVVGSAAALGRAADLDAGAGVVYAAEERRRGQLRPVGRRGAVVEVTAPGLGARVAVEPVLNQALEAGGNLGHLLAHLAVGGVAFGLRPAHVADTLKLVVVAGEVGELVGHPGHQHCEVRAPGVR